MRLLYLSRPFLNSVDGTGEQAVAREANAVLSGRPGIRIDHVYESVIKPYGSVWSIVAYDYLATLLFALKHLIKPYDIVILNSPYQAAFVRLMRVRKTKIVCVAHDFFYKSYSHPSVFDRYSSIIYAHAIKNSDVIVTTTSECEEELLKYYSAQGVMAPLGTSIIKSSVKREYNPDRQVVVGYIGAYSARKRPEYLIDLARINDGTFKMVLAGGITQDIKRQIEGANLNGSPVQVLGKIPEGQKPSFYGRLDFLYFPTRLEGFGLPLVEAMKTGVIPIVHRDAIIPSVVKAKCMIVDSPNGVVSIISDYRHSPSKYCRTAEDNKAYSELFDWEIFVDKLLGESGVRLAELSEAV